MLRSISIRNLAVVASADVRFDPGLTVLSGETGVGKSILMDAVDLLLGGRASTDVIRTGESSTTLTAVVPAALGVHQAADDARLVDARRHQPAEPRVVIHQAHGPAV